MTGRLDMAAARVLAEFPACGPGPRLEPLGNRGGFSGARLWRVTASGATFCLRAWPAPGPTPERLAWIHQLVMQAVRAGLSFVPRVHAVLGGVTWVRTVGRLWDLTSWMPGTPDYQAAPSPARLAAACRAIARL